VTPEQHERVREIYLAAREAAPADRAAFLDNACGGDDFVRREVASLLASAEKADTFLRTPALGTRFAVNDPALYTPDKQGVGPGEAERHEATGTRPHPKVAIALYNLANTLLKKGELTEAEVLYDQALAMQREIGGGEHPNAGRMLAKLAELHTTQGNPSAAAASYRDAYHIYAEALPAEHPDRIDAVGRFGTLLLEHSDLVDSELADSVLGEYSAIVRRQHPEDTELIARIEAALGGPPTGRPIPE